MKKIIKTVPFAFLLPGIALAQNLGWFNNVATSFNQVITTLIPAFIALALLVFIWGMVQFILAAGDDEGRRQGKSKMIWGIIALFVIVSIWGIVALLNTFFGTTAATAPPAVPGV